jgi:hypothetical protein
MELLGCKLGGFLCGFRFIPRGFVDRLRVDFERGRELGERLEFHSVQPHARSEQQDRDHHVALRRLQ